MGLYVETYESTVCTYPKPVAIGSYGLQRVDWQTVGRGVAFGCESLDVYSVESFVGGTPYSLTYFCEVCDGCLTDDLLRA